MSRDRVHFRTRDRLVHLCDVTPASSAYCIPRCDKTVRWQVAAGDVELPVTCLGCLAEDPASFAAKNP